MKTIGIIAPSGVVEEEKLNRAVSFLEAQGFKVKTAKNIINKKRYLVGNDEEKIEELHKFFQNDDIDLIMCARGGIKIAMGNATEELKAVADDITDTVYNDGFVKAMEKYVLGKR